MEEKILVRATVKWRDEFHYKPSSNNNHFSLFFQPPKIRDNNVTYCKRQDVLTISSTAGRVLGLCRRNGKSADMQDSTQDWIRGSWQVTQANTKLVQAEHYDSPHKQCTDLCRGLDWSVLTSANTKSVKMQCYDSLHSKNIHIRAEDWVSVLT